jgi:sugar phosphate permease
MVPLTTRLIDIFEWRAAMAILGFVAWGILLPLSLLFRHKPEQYGLYFIYRGPVSLWLRLQYT